MMWNLTWSIISFQVYNETIRDLLIPSGCLPIREDSTSGVVIPGLSLHKVNQSVSTIIVLKFRMPIMFAIITKQSFLCSKGADGMAKIVETLIRLHCLPRPVCSKDFIG